MATMTTQKMRQLLERAGEHLEQAADGRNEVGNLTISVGILLEVVSALIPDEAIPPAKEVGP